MIRRASVLFGLQLGDYLIASIGIITLNSRLYLETAIADGLLLVIGFTSVKKIVEATTKTEMAAYVIGGVAGTQVAILLSNWMGW